MSIHAVIPFDVCIHQLFEAQADRTPDAVAVVLDGRSMTYRELDERANQLAHRLQALGVQPEALVALCVERSPEMVIGLLGILKAGAAYVPLDPSYPADRLRFMLDDAEPAVIVTQQHLLAVLPLDRATESLCLDRDEQDISAQRTARATRPVRSRNLAYVIYTSGSSGRPKGTMIEHRSVCNVLSWLQDSYPLTPEDAVVQRIPFAFDGSVCDFYWPLMTGARLVLLRADAVREPDYVARVIDEQRVTAMILVPSMLSVLIDRPSLHAPLRRLRRVFCGGETLAPGLASRFFACMAPGTDLVNLYGPTETTVFVTAWRCERDGDGDGDGDRARLPIGHAIANTWLHVLDEDGNRVPAGQPGELFVGGAGLARGYLNQPALTAERFRCDVAGEPGVRLYRTGDLVRRLPDSALEHLGRLDAQVKLRGFRIELGEVAAALDRQPAVRDAAVVLREDRPGDARLVGYVVARAGHELSAAALTRELARILPDYMVPASIVILEALPVTPHGKLDRSALPAPDARELEPEYAAPRTPLEHVLTSIVAEILDLERVGVTDQLFRLGLNSLQAARIAHITSDALGVPVTVGDIFAHATVERLIEALASDGAQRAMLEQHAQQLWDLTAPA